MSERILKKTGAIEILIAIGLDRIPATRYGGCLDFVGLAGGVTNLLRGVNLYLIGMMGSGKTTIGRILAQQLGYQFFDTDALIEQATQQRIPDLFATIGEAAFRDLETEVLSELAPNIRLAIATGGGIVLKRQNWSYLQHGVVVWLDVSPDLLYDRLQDDQNRPILQNADLKQKLQDLFAQRRSLYAQADVHVSVSVDEPPEDTADRVLNQLRTVIKPDPRSSGNDHNTDC